MAIIIRETRFIGGKKYPQMKVYKSDRLLTEEMRLKADNLDNFLHDHMQKVKDDLEHLISSKDSNKTKDILEVRYEIGKRLKFVDDPKIVHPDDKRFIWRALYDHAPELAPGPPRERANKRPETSFFNYCCKLSRLPWKVVKTGGAWASWQRFFDLGIKNDDRILIWLAKISPELKIALKENWLKKATKLITEQFHNRDTTVLEDVELNSELKQVFNKL